MVAKIGYLWAAKGFSKIGEFILVWVFFSLVKVVEMKKVSVGRFGPCC